MAYLASPANFGRKENARKEMTARSCMTSHLVTPFHWLLFWFFICSCVSWEIPAWQGMIGAQN